MIGLSSKAFDVTGSLQLHKISESRTPNLTRRVTTTATIDGNNVLSDLGLSEADGAWDLLIHDVGVSSVLEGLIKNHSKIILTSRNGAFEGVIKSLNLASSPKRLMFLAEKKIS